LAKCNGRSLAIRISIYFNQRMSFKVLRLALLVAVVVVQGGCATTKQASDDPPTPDLEPVPSHDDSSHGWGANIKGM
jgi:hypothetical protein